MLKFILIDLCIKVSKLTISGVFDPKIDVIGEIEKLVDECVKEIHKKL